MADGADVTDMSYAWQRPVRELVACRDGGAGLPPCRLGSPKVSRLVLRRIIVP